MGRVAIDIKEIGEQRKRTTTFNKRKTGLFKKAMELSILTKSKILLVVIDESDTLFEYSSKDDPRPLLRKYFTIAHLRHERTCNDDYDSLYGSKKGKKKTGGKSKPPIRSNPSLLHLDPTVNPNLSTNRPHLPPPPPMIRPPQQPRRRRNQNEIRNHRQPPSDPRHDRHPQTIHPKHDLPWVTKRIPQQGQRKTQQPSGNRSRRRVGASNSSTIKSPPNRPMPISVRPRSHEPYQYQQSTGFTPLPIPNLNDDTQEPSLSSILEHHHHHQQHNPEGNIHPQDQHHHRRKSTSTIPVPDYEDMQIPPIRREDNMNTKVGDDDDGEYLDYVRSPPPSSKKMKIRKGLRIEIDGRNRIPIDETTSNNGIKRESREKGFDIITPSLVTPSPGVITPIFENRRDENDK